MIIATSRGHSKTSIPKLMVLHIFSTTDINRIYNEIIAIMLFIQRSIVNRFIKYFITIFRFTNFKQNLIIGSLKEISKWMRIHKLLAREDASKNKAHGKTRLNGGRANKTTKVKWGRGKREANGK